MKPDWVRRAVFILLFLAFAVPTWVRRTPPRRWQVIAVIFVGLMLVLSWNLH